MANNNSCLQCLPCNIGPQVGAPLLPVSRRAPAVGQGQATLKLPSLKFAGRSERSYPAVRAAGDKKRPAVVALLSKSEEACQSLPSMVSSKSNEVCVATLVILFRLVQVT